MKTSVSDELFRQTEKMNKAEAAKNKDKELNIIRSPVKRKLKFGIATSKERKQKICENLDDEAKVKQKESLKKRMQSLRENFGDEEKVKQKESAKKGMQSLRENDKQRKDNVFGSVQDHSMVDPSILDTEAFKIIESEFKDAINTFAANDQLSRQNGHFLVAILNCNFKPLPVN